MNQFKTFEKNGVSKGSGQMAKPKPLASGESIKRRIHGLAGKYQTQGKVTEPDAIQRRLNKKPDAAGANEG